MKTLAMQRRLAAKVMNIGLNKVWFDPERLNEIKEAITKSDIESLIKEGAISKKPVSGCKRRAGKLRQKRKRLGRGRGIGKKKKIVKRKKENYMIKIRNLRSYLKALKRKGIISCAKERKLRRLAKAGIIKNKRDIEEKIKEL